MKHPLDMDRWTRKAHYAFFRRFDEPFFGVCVEIDCTVAYDICKERDCSFFLYYLYKSLVAANAIEPFRYRIAEGGVWVYDQVNASPTINRPDGTFGFAYMNYEADFDLFLTNARLEMARVQNSQGLEPAISGENVIHYSAMPWIRFTSVSHARSLSTGDCIPKITFGKWAEKEKTKSLPVSIHVHHALMDGSDVGRFLDMFQHLMSQR